MNFKMTCYKSSPLRILDGIPVFSEHDFYIANYDRISADHLRHFEKTGCNPFMSEDHLREIEDSTENVISKYLDKKSLKILDVGVGMGRLLDRFPYTERYGMDISHEYLKHAKLKGIEVCLSRVEDMPYEDEYFDMVICTDVLEHVLDINLAVDKILSTLKAGGVLIIRVPYKEDLSPYLAEEYPYDLVHLRNFDEHSLKILFEKIFHLEVIEHSFTGYRGGPLRLSGGNMVDQVSRLILQFIKKFNLSSYSYLSKVFCKPVEINMVARKVMR